MSKSPKPVTEQEKKTLLLVSSSFSIHTIESGNTLNVFENGSESNYDADSSIISKEDRLAYAHRKKRNFYTSFLKNHFENLVVLSGAGTSVGFGGKTMAELWTAIETEIGKDTMDAVCEAVRQPKDNSLYKKDLEGLLSRCSRAKDFIGDKFKIYGKDGDIEDFTKECEKLIKKECGPKLKPEAPHGLFLNKLVNRKLKDPRVKVFTLNYDTLFEQAAIDGNFTIIDGFSFTHPRTLSGRNFDLDIVYREKSRIKEEESFVPKVFHLYKPHGSINWELKDRKVIINEETQRPLMIFPKDSKYESSYEQPYFEMMSRFQQNLRNDNVLLICAGYSFNDKHINTAINEAVTQNPSFRLLVVVRTIREQGEMNEIIKQARNSQNVYVVAEEFADFVKNYPTTKTYSETN